MNIGFRTEDFSGEGFRDAASVMSFETFELENTDILETLTQTILKGTKIGTIMERVASVMDGDVDDYDVEKMLDDYHDDSTLGIPFYQDVLSEIKKITGKDIKFCLWLCDTKEDILFNYNNNGELYNASFDAYELSDIILSDIGTAGKLYGYETEPHPVTDNFNEEETIMKTDIYWQNKEERARIAADRTSDREKRFEADIESSYQNGRVYTTASGTRIGNKYPCDIIIDNIDVVSAVYKYSEYKKPVCVLNFASFHNPGGKFLEGSSAQEESICMDSTLFNVLRRFEDVYRARKGRSNNCLYTDEAIYTPDIIFDRNNEIVKCDVITCAAVNASAARRWHKTSKEVTEIMMADRMRFVLDVAASMGARTLILGAFGCGVFGNDPAFVADEFYGLLRDEQFRYDRFFDTVVFAVPTLKDGDTTFNIFKDVFLS